jgi:hypothetical protein
MILLKEHSGVAFRDDILRGVRFFLIAFSVVLFGIWVHRLMHAPAEVQTADQNAYALSDAAPPEQPTDTTAANAETDPSAETHGLMVPPPPPVGGKPAPVRTARRPRTDDVPPPPPLRPSVQPSRAPAPSGRDFEVRPLPVALAKETVDTTPVPVKEGVGYKSLIEANANRPPVETAAPVPAEAQAEKPQKGNRFFHAIGKIFHPGGPKETLPLTLQPKPQQ